MSIKNHPSTLVGYGITDAVSKKNLREIMDGQNTKHTEQDKKNTELDKKIAELDKKIAELERKNTELERKIP